MADFEWDEFEAAVRLLKSAVPKKLPFREVIKAATGHRILPFDDSSRNIINYIDEWIDANLLNLSNHIEAEYEGRSNELGNFLENFLIKELQIAFKPSIHDWHDLPTIICEKPRTAAGHAQATGYPDGVIFSGDNVLYFDVKIYQGKNKNDTLRTFYYQPTNQSKIQHDAPHFLIGFEVESLGGSNRSPFRIVDYNIIDIYDMNVNFKAEFNTNNKELYNLERL